MKNAINNMVVCLFIILILCNCINADSVTTPTQTQTITIQAPNQTETYSSSLNEKWWNKAVFYEIFVRSFYDSNGDGIGDIEGIVEKLDYLNDGNLATSSDLGVDALWLMPIYPSESYHGYDVTDYLNINPDYGNLIDFKRFVNEAHRRGIRVIIDLVLNHTSVKHPWFIEAQKPDSSYVDYYIWSETDPGYLGANNQKVWYQADNGRYYYATFSKSMPDLNYRNPKVTQEMYAIVQYWTMEMGVDGFRLDGARYLIEEGRQQSNTNSTHQWLKDFRKFYKILNPDLVTVGEIWDRSSAVSKYVEGDELDLAFDFDLATAFINSVANSTSFPTKRIIEDEFTSFNNSIGMATFLTNHDMTRSINNFAGSKEKSKVAAALLLTSPGVPFLYYGEEIGMAGTKPDPQIRTPMQWSSAENANFSAHTPWETVNPDFHTVNVASEISDPNSLLSIYRALIKLRNDQPVLRHGNITIVKTENNNLYAALRWDEDEVIVVLLNLSKKELLDMMISLPQGPLSGKYSMENLMDGSKLGKLSANESGGFEQFIPKSTIYPSEIVIILLNPEK